MPRPSTREQARTPKSTRRPCGKPVPPRAMPRKRASSRSTSRPITCKGPPLRLRRRGAVVIVAYDHRLGPDTMLVTDFVREQEREKNNTATIVEMGIRRQMTPLTVLGIGLGTGIAH